MAIEFKTTTKWVKDHTAPAFLVYAGYCDLQALLINHSRIAYTSGTYGWNYDVFDLYGKTICTGYRGMPGRRANNIEEYERKAVQILGDTSKEYKERSQEIEELLKEFCKQA